MEKLTEEHYQAEIVRLHNLCDVLEKASWRKSDDLPPFDKDVLCYDKSADRLFVGSFVKSFHGPPFWCDEECTYVQVDMWADIERPKC